MARGTGQGELIDPTTALSRLLRMLSETDDADSLTMLWAVHALQNDRSASAEKHLNFLPQANTSSMDSPFAVFPWDIETLITIMLNMPKSVSPPWLRQPMNVREFNTVANLINLLRAADEHDSDDRVTVENVLKEMHRIAHRTFAWQRGWANVPETYRSLFIYGQGLSGQYFEETNGLSIVDFYTVAFLYMSVFFQKPWTTAVDDLGFFNAVRAKARPAERLLAAEISDARRESLALLSRYEKSAGKRLPIVYRPSYLRMRPMVQVSTEVQPVFIAPLPTLLLHRATVGLYYDIIKGGTKIRNDAAARFEEYCRKSIEAHCPAFEVSPPVKYKFKGNPVETPDVILQLDGQVVAVMECKASKLTFEAQYADNPIEDAQDGYAQIAKAIFQMWRFFSHVRRNLLDFVVADDAPAVVLTLDAWTLMSSELRNEVIAEARRMVAEKEPAITDEDQRPPVFCPLHELDHLLLVSSEQQLLDGMKAAILPEYDGWALLNVRQNAVEKLPQQKRYAFDPAEFIGWWGELSKRDR
ncbi:hypothetical protein GR158_18705 [Shinella sp. AETb1-6]|uniref:hypothetical protein n=1 Tax=Shinella sp. AETb1-6 TaxID=2692210 RepID=UPI00136AFCC2|nr:hypothetical protein [Shinella sp. AETb1-6]MXN53144.1 hypothetical protein [Shinella sp. AETb1-6]